MKYPKLSLKLYWIDSDKTNETSLVRNGSRNRKILASEKLNDVIRFSENKLTYNMSQVRGWL